DAALEPRLSVRLEAKGYTREIHLNDTRRLRHRRYGGHGSGRRLTTCRGCGCRCHITTCRGDGSGRCLTCRHLHDGGGRRGAAVDDEGGSLAAVYGGQGAQRSGDSSPVRNEE